MCTLSHDDTFYSLSFMCDKVELYSVLAECINNLTRRQNCTERIRSSLMIFNISHVFPLHCTFDMWTGKLSFIFILMPEWMMTLPVYSSKCVTKNNCDTCNHISIGSKCVRVRNTEIKHQNQIWSCGSRLFLLIGSVLDLNI